METKTEDLKARKMLPILKSIAREVKDRTAAIAFLEARVESFKKSPQIHAEDLRLAEAALAIDALVRDLLGGHGPLSAPGGAGLRSSVG